MANHVSAVKRYRQSERRRATNSMNRHRLKTQLKKFKTALESGKPEDAKSLLSATLSVIDKSVQKGVLKENTARRYKSQFARGANAKA